MNLEDDPFETTTGCPSKELAHKDPANALLQVGLNHVRFPKLDAMEKSQTPSFAVHAMETSSNASVAEIRLEMAQRALTMIDEDEGPASDSKAGPADENIVQKEAARDIARDVVKSEVKSGSTTTLNEAGYREASSCCCPLEMSVYITRLITHLGFKVCNEGSLQGFTAWYYCANQSRTFQELSDEVEDAADGECAWVGTESSCPARSKNCPTFPDTSRRRRSCLHRHVEMASTTAAPETTTYTVQADTHCGYFMDCGGEKNALLIGGTGGEYTNTTKPAADCTPVCNNSPECVGFLYTHSGHKCYYRKNTTCGVFKSEGNECWTKP